MKAKIKVPRRIVSSESIDMFSYIEYDVEGTADEIEDIYNDVMNDKEGLNRNEWAELRDEVEMNGGEMTPDMMETFNRCSRRQRYVINQMTTAKRRTET